MTNDDVILVGKFDYPFEKAFVRHCGSGIVRIIDPEELCLLGNVRRDGVQIRQKIIFLFQRQEIIFATVESGADVVDGITRTRYQDDIARVDEGHGHVADAFFRADQ